jgi:hypothetical protein
VPAVQVVHEVDPVANVSVAQIEQADTPATE